MTDTASTPDEDPATRWALVSDRFTRQATNVEGDRWDRSTPCVGWVARDIVRHLVEWVPPFLAAGAGHSLDTGPDVNLDPVGAWMTLAASISRIFEDGVTASAMFDHPQAGRYPIEGAVDRFITGDVLIHTWDLARATGGAPILDANAVAWMLPGIEAMGDALAASGHYAKPVPLGANADPQSRLLAATGRDPLWQSEH